MIEHVMFGLVVLIGLVMFYVGVCIIPEFGPLRFNPGLFWCGGGVLIVYIWWKTIYD